MDNIPASLGAPVQSSTRSWEQLVIRAWGSEYRKPDVAYVFSNGRTFDSTDQWESGVYKRG